MLTRLKPHIGQFSLYVLGGFGALAADLSTYYFLLYVGVWYIVASLISGLMGFFTAFLLHKYMVFRKRDDFLRHLGKYFAVDIMNNCITTGVLYVLVHQFSVDPHPAKIFAIMPMVLWNFLLYKFFVYV